MPDVRFQRRHYDELARTKGPTRYGLSCGYRDRYDPALLERRPLLGKAWEALLDRMFQGGQRPSSLLDLGCGTAYYWPALAERCDRLVGVDLSPAMLEAGLRHRHRLSLPGGEGVASDVSRLPFAAESFDAVLAVDVLHHVQDLPSLAAEVARVLRPRGTFVSVEPNVWNPVVFLAHLLPPEERGALWPNNPRAVAKALEPHFLPPRSEPITYVSGLDWEPALRLVERVEPLLRRPPLSTVALRRLLVARRRP